MKRILAAIVMFTAVLNAKEPPRNHQGVLLRMESVACGPAESSAAGNAIFGTLTASDPSEERLCPEYILRSEGLLYRIRQRAGKRANLLPIGATAKFRFNKFRMLLQVEDFDRKIYEFHVMAIIPENRGDSFNPAADAGKKSTD